MPVSEADKALAKRVRLAVGVAAYGSSLFPTWRFHVSAGRRLLVIQAPGTDFGFDWEWEPDLDATDEQIVEVIDACVSAYLRALRESGIDLWPAEA